MNYIKIIIKQKEYPYKDEPFDSEICWCQIQMQVINKKGIVLCNIFNLEWDLRTFIDWNKEYKDKILGDTLHLGNRIKKNSIMKSIFGFYNGKINSQKIDYISTYREAHNIRFAFRGVDLIDIYLGKNGRKMEISFRRDSSFYRFNINIIDYFKHIEEVANKVNYNC